MKINRSSQFAGLAVFALLLLPAAFGADEEQKPERGSVEFGVRYVWGDVYGRPDLQIGPVDLGQSLGDARLPGLRNGIQSLVAEFEIRRVSRFAQRLLHPPLQCNFRQRANSKNYINLQSQKTLYRDQSYLATFGQYGKFKIQFRYDEIPHVYSDTARTLFTANQARGVEFPSAVRSTIQASSAANLPSLLAGTGANAANGVVTNFNFLTPEIMRKAGTALVSYNVTPDLNIFGSFMRESQNGTRPIGLIMNSSPSASATSGFGVELPETISYFNNLVRVGAEYGKHDWGVQAAYIGSFFQQNIPSHVL